MCLSLTNALYGFVDFSTNWYFSLIFSIHYIYRKYQESIYKEICGGGVDSVLVLSVNEPKKTGAGSVRTL